MLIDSVKKINTNIISVQMKTVESINNVEYLLKLNLFLIQLTS